MKTSFLLASTLSCMMFASAQAQDKPMSQADVEALVKKVIADHPELIVQSVQNYQLKEQAQANAKAGEKISTMQSQLAHDKLSPFTGNPHGDVTVVEFFDYHCHYCKDFFPRVAQLVDEDKKVRVVFKEFPILSEDSELASKAALAVNSIDPSKYFAFHMALMKSTGRFDMAMLTSTAKEAGINEDDFKKAMENPALDKELQDTKALAATLGVSGTPAIIIGNQLIPGAIDLNGLKAKIAAEREAKDKNS